MPIKTLKSRHKPRPSNKSFNMDISFLLSLVSIKQNARGNTNYKLKNYVCVEYRDWIQPVLTRTSNAKRQCFHRI